MVFIANGLTFSTIPDISSLLKPLESVIFYRFIPANPGRSVSELERSIFTLPVRLGGLGVCDPQQVVNSEFDFSVKVTSALVNQIIW